tara:strand:+ start:17135 stop:17503 length:369 start_codon:yes stop_codon:yes gene_type:complete
MSEKEEKKETVLGLIWRLIKNLSAKIKLAIGAAIALFGMILFFKARGSNDIKKILEYELKKVRSEIEIEKAKESVSVNNDAIDKLEEKEKIIRDKIKEIESSDTPEEVSLDELDDFFDSRGF